MDSYIKISFNSPYFKDFNEIYFLPNQDITYYDNSHMNYIYKEIKDDVEYTFHGFFKDTFFVIIMDTYNNKLKTNIENKYIFLIKMNWILKKISEDKSVWILDIPEFNKLKIDSYILAIRQKIFIDSNINIEDYIKINNYKIISIIVKYTFEKKINIFKYIKSFVKNQFQD